MANGYGNNAYGYGASGTPLTAGQKAAATRRARQAAGLPPKTSGRARRTGGAAFVAPKPTSAGLKLVVLSALEDLFIVRLKENGITPEARKSYERYSKLKALALGPTSSAAAQTEADSALRMATIDLIKLTY